MSATSIAAAQSDFATHQKSLSGYTVTNFKLVDGYGISWTQNGENRSAQIGYMKQNDADYKSTYQSLLSSSSTKSDGTGLSSSSQSISITSVSSWPTWLKIVIGGIILLLGWRFFKKRKKRR